MIFADYRYKVHWDHIGEPIDFPSSKFVVGHGSLALLAGSSSSSSLRGGHSFFEHDLLPKDRTIELPDPAKPSAHQSQTAARNVDFTRQWRAVDSLPQTLDVFGDGSLLIANAPGHLPGHINLLARVSRGHQIYMAGDACHDRRLLTGEKSIGEWDDVNGHSCCIHADRKEAEATIERIRLLEKQGVEIIFAHDVEWESNPSNNVRYFGAGQ
jgi:glyoxylase-like metal-dependent hydrolase (beta-lactamase superfamily II)